MSYKIFFCLKTNHPLSTTFLYLKGRRRKPLDVAVRRHRNHHLFLRYKILLTKLSNRCRNYFCSSCITKTCLNIKNLCFYYSKNFFRIREKSLKFNDKSFLFLKLVLNLFSFETSKSLELHFKDGICLKRRKSKLLHQILPCLLSICRLLNSSDHLVNVIKRFCETLKNMRTLFRLTQIILCTPHHNYLPVF